MIIHVDWTPMYRCQRIKRPILLFGMSWRWNGSTETNNNVLCIWFWINKCSMLTWMQCAPAISDCDVMWCDAMRYGVIGLARSNQSYQPTISLNSRLDFFCSSFFAVVVFFFGCFFHPFFRVLIFHSHLFCLKNRAYLERDTNSSVLFSLSLYCALCSDVSCFWCIFF